MLAEYGNSSHKNATVMYQRRILFYKKLKHLVEENTTLINCVQSWQGTTIKQQRLNLGSLCDRAIPLALLPEMQPDTRQNPCNKCSDSVRWTVQRPKAQSERAPRVRVLRSVCHCALTMWGSGSYNPGKFLKFYMQIYVLVLFGVVGYFFLLGEGKKIVSPPIFLLGAIAPSPRSIDA